MQVFSSHQELLESGVCDVVIVSTPNMTHFQILMDIINHPRPHHILVEKPLCTTVQDCNKVTHPIYSSSPIFLNLLLLFYYCLCFFTYTLSCLIPLNYLLLVELCFGLMISSPDQLSRTFGPNLASWHLGHTVPLWTEVELLSNIVFKTLETWLGLDRFQAESIQRSGQGCLVYTIACYFF